MAGMTKNVIQKDYVMLFAIFWKSWNLSVHQEKFKNNAPVS